MESIKKEQKSIIIHELSSTLLVSRQLYNGFPIFAIFSRIRIRHRGSSYFAFCPLDDRFPLATARQQRGNQNETKLIDTASKVHTLLLRPSTPLLAGVIRLN